MYNLIMIFFTIIYWLVPVFGGPDPHGLGKYTGLFFFFAIVEISIELFVLQRIINKGKGKSKKSLRDAEKSFNSVKSSRKH